MASRVMPARLELRTRLAAGSGWPVQGPALAHRVHGGRIEWRERMAERLRRPHLQPEELDDGGMAVVGLIDVAHERLEERTVFTLHVLEHRILLRGGEIFERLGVSAFA